MLDSKVFKSNISVTVDVVADLFDSLISDTLQPKTLMKTHITLSERPCRLLCGSFAVLVAASLLFNSTQARADLIAYNTYTHGTVDNNFSDFGPGGDTVGRFAQGVGFTSAATGVVSKIYASLYDFGSSASEGLQLYAADGPIASNGVHEQGTLLGTFTGPISPSGGGGSHPSVLTGPSVALTAGTAYWLIAPDSPGVNYAWTYPSPNTFSGPHYSTAFDVNSGFRWQSNASANGVEVLVAPVPEPSTVALAVCAAGACGLIRLRRRTFSVGTNVCPEF